MCWCRGCDGSKLMFSHKQSLSEWRRRCAMRERSYGDGVSTKPREAPKRIETPRYRRASVHRALGFVRRCCFATNTPRRIYDYFTSTSLSSQTPNARLDCVTRVRARHYGHKTREHPLDGTYTITHRLCVSVGLYVCRESRFSRQSVFADLGAGIILRSRALRLPL